MDLGSPIKRHLSVSWSVWLISFSCKERLWDLIIDIDLVYPTRR